MAKIYWFTGKSGSGKTTLGKKLTDFLSTEKRNWRSKVFHIDTDDIRELTSNHDYSTQGVSKVVSDTHMISEYIYRNGCDVVVSVSSPFFEQREEFKDRIGADLEEFYVHSSKRNKLQEDIEYTPPVANFFDIDTTKENSVHSFNRIVHYLRNR